MEINIKAHIAGVCGKKIRSNRKIGTIIALDPASQLFDHNDLRYSLAKTDANYVQVIHTDIDDTQFGYGIAHPIGHADFYPNTGKVSWYLIYLQL